MILSTGARACCTATSPHGWRWRSRSSTRTGRYEALAADERPEAFLTLWRHFIGDTIESAAFVELAVDARRSLANYDGETRMKKLLSASLKRAQGARLVDAALTVETVLLAHRMAFGIIATSLTTRQLQRDVRAALALVPHLPPL